MDFAYILAVVVVCTLIGALIFGLRLYLTRLVDRRIAAFQSDLIGKYCDEVQNIYREMRDWRHDYHNHIQTMKSYRYLGENDLLDTYLAQLETDLTNIDTLLKSGNIMLDAILNSKLSLAQSRGVTIHAKARVPASLPLSETDLCVILGNLLDNALEATSKLPQTADRLIRVYIDIKKDQLYISVTNTSGGEIRRKDGRYLSLKEGNHGFGLLRVDRLVAKHNGYLKRRDETGAFTTEILLPL